MISRRSLAALAASSFIMPATGSAQGTAMPARGKRVWASDVPEIRIGLLGGENDADRLTRYNDFRQLMEDTFQVPIRLYPAADYSGVMQAFSAGQIEASSMGASGYAGTWLDTNGAVEPLLVAIENDGSSSYISVMLARKDSGIDSLAKMQGKSLAWADPNSTSGYLIPRSELRSTGIDINSFFSRTGFAGGHEQGVVAMVQKQYDACCTAASGIGDESKGFSRGNLHSIVAKGLVNMADINIIWRSRPIPNGPLVVRRVLPAAFKEDLANFYLALPTAYPAIYADIARGDGNGFARATHEMFEPIVQMRRQEAAERRRRS